MVLTFYLDKPSPLFSPHFRLPEFKPLLGRNGENGEMSACTLQGRARPARATSPAPLLAAGPLP